MKQVLFLFVAALSVLPASSQERKSPHETVTGKDITVTYGRPYKKGRDIFGGLQKYGDVWRTGADEATTIVFAKDTKFGGQSVKAGTYTLYTIPGEKEWTIIINGQTKQWGTVYNKDKDVVRFTVPSKTLDKVVEQLTIRIPDNSMIIEWDKTQVAIPVTS